MVRLRGAATGLVLTNMQLVTVVGLRHDRYVIDYFVLVDDECMCSVMFRGSAATHINW